MWSSLRASLQVREVDDIRLGFFELTNGFACRCVSKDNFYFVMRGECRLVKRYSGLEQKQRERKTPCFVEISTICR